MKKKIHINRLGYMTGMPKSAVCSVTAGIFYLVDAVRGVSVYAGRLSHPFYDRESGDTVRLADFSDYNVKGRYFIRAGYRRSDEFEISENPYKNIRSTILHGIYLNRCGFNFENDSFSEREDEDFMRRECHMDPIAFRSDSDATRNVSGGWHSAGCYCRNTVSACLTAADMLYALKLFRGSFPKPERVLIEDECRWGLDWLMKMQDSDGGVYSGIDARHSDTFVAPDEDNDEYFIEDKTCRAALRFTAVTALAADCFRGVDMSYAKKLRNAAEKSWLWIVQSDEYNYYTGKDGSCSESGEGAFRLESDFMWAMCEMYSLTGDDSFADIISRKYVTSVFTGFGGTQCGGFAALSYLLSEHNRDRAVEAFIRKRLIDRAERMLIAIKESGYRTARSAGGGYCYGSNADVLSDCMDFITAYLISGDQRYLSGATDQFSYIFGQNPMDIMYMTGAGEEYCRFPSHKLSISSNSDSPLPGMIVSGANGERGDEYSKWHIEKGMPPAKCYIDNEYSFSTNEPAVHFSAPVIFVSAFYDKVGRSALSGLREQG